MCRALDGTKVKSSAITLILCCIAIDTSVATCGAEISLTDLDADALEVQKVWGIAADSSLKIREQTVDWMPETKSYFKSTFDWRHCLRKNANHSQLYGGAAALMDPGLEPSHPKHAESTNQFNPKAIYRRSPPPVLIHRGIGLPRLLLQFANNFKDCKESFENLVNVESNSKQQSFDNLVDHLTALRKVQEAENLHNKLKKSIQTFADLAGEEATTVLLKDLESTKQQDSRK